MLNMENKENHMSRLSILKACDFLQNAKFISILFKFAFLFWNYLSSKNIRLSLFSLIIFKILQKSNLSRYECTQNVSGIRTIHCPGLGIFFCLWKSVKWPEIQPCKKIVYSGAQRNFLLLLGQHPYNGVLFLLKTQKTSCGSGGQYALSCGSFPGLFWCQYSFQYAFSQLP